MNALRDTVGLYVRYVGVAIRAQLQYRASFVLMSIGQFVVTIVEAIGIWALFDRFGALPGWSLAQVAMFYGVVNVAFALADAVARGFDVFGTEYLRTGHFDRLLVRPRSTLLQVAGQNFALYRIGRIAQGLLVLGLAVAWLDIDWGAGNALLLAGAIVGGMALFTGLVIVQATIAFWTVESLELMNTLTYGGVEAAQYPLSIYARWLRDFFTYIVPLACVAYFPVVAVLGVEDPLGSARWQQVLAPLAGVAFLLGACAFWQVGVRRYTSTGS